jgi:hypothetical protein
VNPRKLTGLGLLCLVGAILCAARILAGCLPPSKGAREAAAEASYTGEHMACVDRYDTHAQIDACRDEVRRRWGVRKDGGR